MNGLAQAAPTPITGPALDNKRVAAALIDLIVLFLVGALLGALAGGFTGGARLLSVAWVLYYYFALESMTGQTVGKRLLGLRVVQADGSPPSMGQIAIRTALRLVDGIGLYLVGLIVMLATGERRQRLGDLAAGTIVTTAQEERRRPDDFEAPVQETAPIVPLHQPEPEPEPASPPPPPPPAAVEEPAFEPYRAPEPPAPAPEAPEPVAEQPEPVAEAPEPIAEQPYIELVPDEPAEHADEPAAEKPRMEIVSPIDLVMADDDEPKHDDPPPPQPA